MSTGCQKDRQRDRQTAAWNYTLRVLENDSARVETGRKNVNFEIKQ